MDLNAIRLECLKLAACLNVPPDKVIGIAKRMYEFVMSDSP
jgi:hypothetical protein